MNFLGVNEPFAVSALIIALGYLLKRVGMLKPRDGEILAKIALNVTLPAVILLNVPSVPIEGSAAVLPLYAPLSTMVMIAIGFFVFRRQPKTDRGLSLSASSGYNNGLFAMPLVAGVYGSAGIARFALMDIGNIISVFITSYILAWIYSPLRDASSTGVRNILRLFLTSFAFMASIIAISMNIAGLEFTGVVRSFLEVAAAMNRGVALLTLGVLLRFRFPPGTWKAILPALTLRYVFGTVAGLTILYLFPGPLDHRIAAATIVVMPVGLTIVPFSVKWGYDRDRAAAILNTGIPVSFVLFWVMWMLGRTLQP